MPLRLIVIIAFFSAWLPVIGAPFRAGSDFESDVAFPAKSFLDFKRTWNNEIYVVNEHRDRKIRTVISIENKGTGAVTKRTIELEPGMKMCLGFALDPQTQRKQKFDVDVAEFLSPSFDESAFKKVSLKSSGPCGPNCLAEEYWLENNSDQYVLVVLEQGGYRSDLMVQSQYMLAPGSRTPVACPVGNLVPSADPRHREQIAFALEGARYLLPTEVACIEQQILTRQLSMTDIQGVVVDPEAEQVIILGPVEGVEHMAMDQSPEELVECEGNCPAIAGAPRCRTACADMAWVDGENAQRVSSAEVLPGSTVNVLQPLRRHIVGCSTPTFGTEGRVCNAPTPIQQP